jgi:hypothetical protein
LPRLQRTRKKGARAPEISVSRELQGKDLVPLKIKNKPKEVVKMGFYPV